MMNFTGLLLGYKKNRPLTDAERKNQLRQKERLELPLNYDLCVIKLNSTFMETVDRHYAWRGTLTPVMAIFIYSCAVTYLSFICTTVIRWGLPDENPQEVMLFLLATGIVLFSSMAICAWIALKETFTLTHFPIRLNRKTRKVHVFRPGRPGRPILTADWDKLFVTMTPCPKGMSFTQDWDIRAHVMADDGETVLDTFAFDFVWDDGELDVLRGHWEFLRRYMEEGPEDAHKLVGVCMPIAEHRETPRFSLNRFHVNFMGGLWLWRMLLPYWLLCVVGRVISMWTSKVPVWPEHIQAECRIEADDPYVKDESNNEKDRLYEI